jgi:hypothetical protein
LVGSLLVDCSLYSYRKIPFTCASVHLLFWFGVIPSWSDPQVRASRVGRNTECGGLPYGNRRFSGYGIRATEMGHSLANRRDWKIEFEDPPPGALIGLHLNR